jgi:large subunit ribosomal protein L5
MKSQNKTTGKKQEKAKDKAQNKMRQIRVDSVTLHCSTSDQNKLERAIKLLKLISNATPVKTIAKKRIPTWKISPGMTIGCKVTVRKQKAVELLKNILTGIRELKDEQFNPGFLSFGVKEYLEIPNIPYQRDIGIMGFDVVATLNRGGWHVAKKKRARGKIGTSHRITKQETIEFFKENFNVTIGE